jgi:probable rRNA maturation factor
MIHFYIDSKYRGAMMKNLLEKAAKTSLERLGKADCEFTIAVSGDQQIRKLNKKFRQHDEPTDVLSFPSGINDQSGYLGDIVISHPRAKAQAKSAGHPVGDEMQLLVVHGLLHLLGYDHDKPAKKRTMWAVQDSILRELGITLDVDRAVAAYK